MMIQVSEHAEGLVLPVRAQPRARKPGVQGEQGGALKLAVSAPPEDGRANEALVEMLAEVLDIRRSQIALLSGQTARDKKFLIRGLNRADLEQRLSLLLAAK
jgi:uncharacterized protein (TIGR00251 family)